MSCVIFKVMTQDIFCSQLQRCLVLPVGTTSTLNLPLILTCKGKQIELVLRCKYLDFVIGNVFLLKLILSGFQTQSEALFPFMK